MGKANRKIGPLWISFEPTAGAMLKENRKLASEIGNHANGGRTDIMTKSSIKWAYLAVAAGLVSGCAVAPLSVSSEREHAVSERDAQLRSLEAQRQKAQRGCERAEAGQCQRAEILNHEMEAYLVRPW